jgi:hypothetical protein
VSSSVRTPAGALLSIVSFFSGLAGCGNPLVPGDLALDPLFTVTGTITGSAPTARSGKLRAALLWVDPYGRRDDRPSTLDESVGLVSPDERTYQIRIFAPPPRTVISDVPAPDDPSKTAFAFAFAEIVAFEDGDDDGVLRMGPRAEGSQIVAPDRFVGAAEDHALFYVSKSRADTTAATKELDFIVRRPVGYVLANAVCMSGTFQGALPSDGITLTLVPPQDTLPQRRLCLRSYPSDEP